MDSREVSGLVSGWYQVWYPGWYQVTCVPHFDHLVGGARDDCFAIGGEGHRVDSAAVGILLLRLKLERA